MPCSIESAPARTASFTPDGPYEWKGRFYHFSLPNTDAAKPYQQNGGPLLYFGGISPLAQELCAKHCDVFLMWPETEERLSETMHLVSGKAAALGRSLDFGLRIHVVVRETESAAREREAGLCAAHAGHVRGIVPGLSGDIQLRGKSRSARSACEKRSTAKSAVSPVTKAAH